MTQRYIILPRAAWFSHLQPTPCLPSYFRSCLMPSVQVLLPPQKQRGYILHLLFSFDVQYSLDSVSSPVSLMGHFSAFVVPSYFNIFFLGSYFISTHCSIQLLQYSFFNHHTTPFKVSHFC